MSLYQVSKPGGASGPNPESHAGSLKRFGISPTEFDSIVYLAFFYSHYESHIHLKYSKGYSKK